MTEFKICTDCKHSHYPAKRYSPGYVKEHTCRHRSATTLDLVDGSRTYAKCFDMRKNYNCGPSGNLFEAKKA